MVAIALCMLVCGLAMSAFFSGSETGFYRASRTRLVLDAMEGDGISRRLLFFVNRPTAFVATALAGNNVANYLVSLAIVLGTRALIGTGIAMEMGATILLSPLVFVYAELLPKNMYYQAPNRLLHRSAPIFWMFAILFAPLTALLRVMGHGLEKLVGQSPTQIRLALAKKELGDVLLEGEAVGILQSVQLEMSQNFFDVATRPATDWMIPIASLDLIDEDLSRSAALRQARTAGLNWMVVGNTQTGRPAGYLSTVDLTVQHDVSSLKSLVQPLPEVSTNLLHGEMIMMMQVNRSEMAGIVDDQGQPVGIVRRLDLLRPVLGESLELLLDPES